MNDILEYRNCFVCGKESRNGLKVAFEITENGARATYSADDKFEGFQGIVHGGILCALLDEVMWKSINAQTGVLTMTVKMEVRFKKPARVGVPLSVEGTLLGSRKRFYEAKGVIADPEGNVLAEATGLFIVPDAESSARMAGVLSVQDD